MDKQSVFEKVCTIISDITDIPTENISLTSEFMDDLELSSLEIMTVVASIEETFSIKVKTDDLQKIVTVEDIVSLVTGSDK